MAGDLVETIGARLTLLNRAAYVKGLEGATAANKAFADSVAAGAAKTAAAGDAQVAAQAKVADANKVSAEAAVINADANKKAAQAAELASLRAQKAAKKITESASSGLERVGTIAGKVAKWGSIGIGGIGYESLKQYLTFQQQMEQTVTQAGLSQKAVNALTPGIMGISEKTGLTFQQVADQLYRIVSASGGLHTTNKELLSLTANAARVAVLGGPGTDPEQVARIFGAIRTSGILLSTMGKRPTSAQMGAWTNATVGLGDVRMPDLIAALGSGGLAQGKLYGMSLQDFGAWFDLMSKQAMGGSKIGTLLTHASSLIVTPTQKAAEYERLLGFKRGDLADIVRTKGVGYAIAALDSAMARPLVKDPTFHTQFYGSGIAGEIKLLSAAQWTPAQIAQMFARGLTPNQMNQFRTDIFGGAKQGVPINLISAELPLFFSGLAALKRESTTSKYNYDVQQALAEPANQIRILERQLQALAVVIGKDVVPTVEFFLRMARDVGGFFQRHPGLTQALLGTAGGLVAASYLVKAYTGTQKIIQTLTGSGSAKAAASLQMRAAELQLEAARLRGGGVLPGGGTGSRVYPTRGPGGEPLPLSVGLLAGVATAVAATTGGNLLNERYHLWAPWNGPKRAPLHLNLGVGGSYTIPNPMPTPLATRQGYNFWTSRLPHDLGSGLSTIYHNSPIGLLAGLFGGGGGTPANAGFGTAAQGHDFASGATLASLQREMSALARDEHAQLTSAAQEHKAAAAAVERAAAALAAVAPQLAAAVHTSLLNSAQVYRSTVVGYQNKRARL